MKFFKPFLMSFACVIFTLACTSIQSVQKSNQEIQEVYIENDVNGSRFTLIGATDYKEFLFSWGASYNYEDVNYEPCDIIKTPHYSVKNAIKSGDMNLLKSYFLESKSISDSHYAYYFAASRFDNYFALTDSKYAFIRTSRSSDDQDIIQNIVLYSMIKKSFSDKILQKHFYDFIVEGHDLDLMVENLGKPAAIYGTTLNSSDGQMIGSLVRVLYNDAYYFVAVGPDCGFSKIIYYYKRSDTLGDMRAKLLGIYGKPADGNIEEFVKNWTDQIMQFPNFFNSKSDHYTSTFSFPEWFDRKYPNAKVKSKSVVNDTLRIVALLEKKHYQMGKCMPLNDWLNVEVKIEEAYQASDAERKQAYDSASAAYEERMAGYSAMLNALGGTSSTGGINTNSNKSSAGNKMEAWYYDSRVGGGKSSPVGPFHTKEECEDRVNQDKDTMDYKITKGCYK